MALWDVFLGRDSNADEALKIARQLSQVSHNEETDLALHSALCARRFETLVTLIGAGLDNSRQNRALLIMLFAFLVLTKVVTVDMITAALKSFF